MWVDDRSFVHRIRQSFAGKPAFEMTMDLFDYGAEEDAEIPSRDDVVDVTGEVVAAAP